MAEVFVEILNREQIERLFAPEKYKKANLRGLKKALDKAYTEAGRAITGVWNLKKKDVKPYLKKRIDYTGQAAAYLTARSKPLGLRLFGARAVRKGVSYKIKKAGRRQTLAESFMREGRPVFTRFGPPHARKRARRSDAVYKSRLVRPRLPIEAKRVITLASILGQDKVSRPVMEAAGETWQREVVRQLTTVLK